MNAKNFILVPVAVLGLTAGQYAANAFGAQPLTSEEQECYSVSMVGFDSVINARMGVPPEHVVDLAATREVTARGGDLYSSGIYGTYLLKVMLNAYLWTDSPHTYAIKVFYKCAVEQSQHHQTASNQ